MTTLVEESKRNIPGWLAIGNLRALVVAVMAQLDDLRDRNKQSVKARLPGVNGFSTLSVIGRERRIPRALNDTDATYAARLTRWLDEHPYRGNLDALYFQITEHYNPTPPTVFNIEYGNGYIWQGVSGAALTRFGPNASNTGPGGDPARWCACAIVLETSSVPIATEADIEDLKKIPAAWVPAHVRCVVAVKLPGTIFFSTRSVDAGSTFDQGTLFDDPFTGYSGEL